MPWFPTATDYQKTGFYTFVEPRKGLGNEACPKWNPQSEFTSDEENSTFQGIFMPMDTLHPEETGAAKLTLQSKVLDHTVYTSSNLVKILILTKGVDFFDTLIFISPLAFHRSDLRKPAPQGKAPRRAELCPWKWCGAGL